MRNSRVPSAAKGASPANPRPSNLYQVPTICPEAVAIGLRPVNEWKSALAEYDEPQRSSIREDLMVIHEGRKLHAMLDKAIAEGKDVWINIPKDVTL